jgi:hypothetical protein
MLLISLSKTRLDRRPPAEVSETRTGQLLPSRGNDAEFVRAPDPATIARACDIREVSEVEPRCSLRRDDPPRNAKPKRTFS